MQMIMKKSRVDEANAKVRDAIATSQSSLARECSTILDKTIGVTPPSRPSNLTDVSSSYYIIISLISY